jgi:hypothetical protein
LKAFCICECALFEHHLSIANDYQLLGFGILVSEYLTLANYASYFFLMTFAWLLIDALGRRKLLIHGSIWLTSCFLLLTVFGGMAMHLDLLNVDYLVPSILGTVTLFTATGAFGIGWLTTVWLIPTEIYPTTARGKLFHRILFHISSNHSSQIAQGTAISVIVWGLANFGITLLTPIMFNNLSYFIFLVFAGTNAIAGLWTWIYLPETGGRSFEENQQFFKDAAEAGTWRVKKIAGGDFTVLKYPAVDGEGFVDAERVPLLRRVC